MAPQEACVRADGFRKGVLRAFDGVFDLRRGGRALFSGLVLEGDRARCAEERHGKAVDELVRHIVQVGAGLGHGIVDRRVQRAVVKLLHRPGGAVLHQRLDDIFRDVAAGGQTVDGVNVYGMPGDVQLALIEVARAVEDRHDIFVRDRACIGAVGPPDLFVGHFLTPALVCRAGVEICRKAACFSLAESSHFPT